MKASYIVELYNFFKKNNVIGFDFAKLAPFAALDENIIEGILKLKNVRNFEQIEYVLFRDLSVEDKLQLINIISEVTSSRAELIIKLLNVSKLKLENKIKISRIIANAKDNECAYDIYRISILNMIYKVESHFETYAEIMELISTNGLHQYVYEFLCEANKKIENYEDILKIAKILANAKSLEWAQSIFDVGLDYDTINNGNLMELVNIVANAKGEKQANWASIVAVDNEAISSGKVVELTKIVANAEKDYQAEYASWVARDCVAIASGKILELTKIVAGAKEEFQCSYSKNAATNRKIAKSDKFVELIKLVSQAKTQEQANCIVEILCNITINAGVEEKIVKLILNCSNDVKVEAIKNIILNSMYSVDTTLKLVEIIKDTESEIICEGIKQVVLSRNIKNNSLLYELVKLISNSVGEEQAKYASNIASDSIILSSGKAKELVKIVSNIENVVISRIVSDIIFNRKLFNDKNILEMVKILENAKGEIQAEYAAVIANKLEGENVLEIMRLVANAKGGLQANYASDVAVIIMDPDTEPETTPENMVEIVKLFANCEDGIKLDMYYKLIFDTAIELEDILKLSKLLENNINGNNIEAVLLIINSGQYKKSKDSIKSLASVLIDECNYVKFKDAYNKTPNKAIEGLQMLNEEFPGYDIDDIEKCYVKIKKTYKQKKSK